VTDLIIVAARARLDAERAAEQAADQPASGRPTQPALPPSQPSKALAVVAALAGPTPDQINALYPPVDWSALWAKAGTPVDWLCEPLLIAGKAVALFSPAKAGKSLLALEIAAALATGRAVLGNKAQPPMAVLYVDLENTEEDLRERLTDLGYGPDSDLRGLRYLSFPTLPALDSHRGGEHLRAVAELHAARLVIIDTVSRVIEGEENNADTFRALYRHAVMPLKAAGRAVLRLDHTGKDLTRGQRGSSAKVDDVDSVWQLNARPGGAIDLKRTHSRNRHGAERITLVRLTGPLRHVLATDAISADVAEVLELLDRLEIPTAWGRDKVRKALTEAGEQRGNDLLTAAISERKRTQNLSADRSEPDDLWTSTETCPEDQEPDQ
jgi:hypothetical protein